MLPTFRTTRCTKSSRCLSQSRYDSTSTSSPSTGAMNSMSTAAPRRRRDTERWASMSAATMNWSLAMASFESILTPPPLRITNCPGEERRIARRSGYAARSMGPHIASRMSRDRCASVETRERRAMSFAASITRRVDARSATSW